MRVVDGEFGGTALVPSPDAERIVSTQRLAEILLQNREAIVHAWIDNAGDGARARFPDLERYLRSLVSGLTEVFSDDEWALTQTIVDALAERRARTGPRIEHGIQRALLAGRAAIRPFYNDDDYTDRCDEILLSALHECIFRFCESYQGIRLASESERVHSRIIKSLVMALEARDPYTKGHSISVALLSQRIAECIGDVVDPTRAYLAGLLHDVGKVGIPDRILLKDGILDDDEWDIMRAHPTTGANILKPIRLYPDVISGVLSHHENYDGSGYPNGLAGEEIPAIGRIIRVTDTFDAMTSSRAYRGSGTIDAACDEIIKLSGHSYDPDIVEAFVRIIETPGAVRELGLASLQIDLGDFAI